MSDFEEHVKAAAEKAVIRALLDRLDSAEQEPVGTVTPYTEHRGAQHYKFTPSENCPTDRRFDVYAAPVSQPAPAAPANDADKLLLREMFALCEDTEEKCAGSDDAFKRGRAFEAKGIRRAIGTWYQATFCGPSFMGEPVLEKTAPAPLPGSTTCPTCGSDCNERDELIKAEREIERLNGLLAAPAPLPELSDKEIDACLCELDSIVREFNHYEYGLPIAALDNPHAGSVAVDMRNCIRAAIAAKKAGA